MSTRPTTAGLHHAALFAVNFEASVDFYTRIMGMRVEWHPDDDNIYLTQGSDNLALHRANTAHATKGQRLDHLGFIVNRPEDVDVWHDYLTTQQVRILAKPKTHRDGARSLYCSDPDGTTIQIIFHPPLAK